jgi:general secretion pathway protein H
MQRQHGLTLLELLVVLAIIGFAVGLVSLSLRDSNQTQLEREAQRLVAVLEAARAQSRTSGIAMIWQATPEGFVIRSTSAPSTSVPSSIPTRTEKWLTAGTQALVSSPNALVNASINNTAPANSVVLGPEPLLTPARITLRLETTNNRQTPSALAIGTDGLSPFQVLP